MTEAKESPLPGPVDVPTEPAGPTTLPASTVWPLDIVRIKWPLELTVADETLTPAAPAGPEGPCAPAVPELHPAIENREVKIMSPTTAGIHNFFKVILRNLEVLPRL